MFRSHLIPLFVLAVLTTSGCAKDDSGETAPAGSTVTNVNSVDLEPFRALARASDCADKSNRLFLIDHRLVFWDRESRCADASYARVLYAGRVDHVVCDLHDSIAGPQRVCRETGNDAALFDIILQYLDAPDLGLGPGHTVKRIDF